MDDYSSLKLVLRGSLGSFNRADWIRASFHELVKGAPEQCDPTDPIHSLAQTVPANTVVGKLMRLVDEKLPGIAFPFGDVLTFAGKLAFEDKVMCTRIYWRVGRPACGKKLNSIPVNGTRTMAQLNPFLTRYGLTARELAVVLAGTHGFLDSRLTVDTESKPWIQIDTDYTQEGQEFVRDSRDLWWTSKNAPANLKAIGIDYTFESDGRVRLPIDMMFYPTSIMTVGGTMHAYEPTLGALERDLYTSYVGNSKAQFIIDFQNAYAKVLEIGSLPGELGERFTNTKRILGGAFCPLNPQGMSYSS